MMYTNEDDKRIYDIISKNIKYFRINNHSNYGDKYNRVTQERLAELCDLSLSMISNIESNRVNQTFSISTLNKIAKVLNVDIKEFFVDRDL